MIHFVGAGPGAPDLITLRGAELLKTADVVIYTGSLVNRALLALCSKTCRIYNSATMTLEEILTVMEAAEKAGQITVRLHTGDVSLYSAMQEQLAALQKLRLPYDITPGVSSFSAAAAALQTEYTLPGVSQSLIISRAEGRTDVPKTENLPSLAAHGTSLVLFLSAGQLPEVQAALLQGRYQKDTPAALVYKASWPEEKVLRCTVGTLAETGKAYGIHQTALVLAGDFLSAPVTRSRLYDPSFSTAFRPGSSVKTN